MTQQMARTVRFVFLAGPAAALLFALSVVGFAALRTDGYTHGTKAISELGAIGAHLAPAFNLLAFIVPGALTIVFAAALAATAPPRARTGPILLALAGSAQIVAGVLPLDLAHRGSPTSLGHGAGALSAGLFWAASLFWLGPLLKRRFGLHLWGLMTPAFLLFLLANVVWQGIWQTSGALLPGWGQRIAFLGYYGWLLVTGWLLFLKAGETGRCTPDETG